MEPSDSVPSWRRTTAGQRNALMWLIAGLLLVLAGRVIVNETAAALRADEAARGVDFRITIFGPSTNISEGLDPWEVDNAVPRFGAFPPSPYLPSLYVTFALTAAAAASTSAAVLAAWSGLLTVAASSAIARSLGTSAAASWIIGALVLLSPASRYNLFLGQFGAAALAAVAYFAVRSRPGHVSSTTSRRPRTW